MRFKSLILITGLFYCTTHSNAQNLVPNPSFEEYIACPNQLGDVNGYLADWFDPNNTTSDYYNVCAGQDTTGVPYNFVGFQLPRTGNAYGGFILYTDPMVSFPNYREYLEVELISALEADSNYCVDFHLSRAHLVTLEGDTLWASTSSVGVYFSAFFTTGGFADTLGYVPQIINDPGNILSDTSQWMHVGGEFVALGGEKFITIGNFFSHESTILEGNTLSHNSCYYYIDDISVTKCSQVTSVNALVETTSLQIFPNPASTEITVTRSSNTSAAFQIVDAFGRMVKTTDTNSHQAVIDVSDIPNGVYFLKQVDNASGAARQTRFVVVR